MISLSALLTTSNSAPLVPEAIPAVLGDPYLYSCNDMFRRVRNASVWLGYKFTDAEDELRKCYMAFPLISLQWLLEVKRIPYTDNTTVLSEAARINPDLAVSPFLLMTSLRRNYLLHEAAHAVAACALDGTTEPFRRSLPVRASFVIDALLSESFANTVERVSSAQATSPLHALYWALNSYIPYKQEEVAAVARLVDRFGQRTIFALGYGLYFFSNVFTRELTEAETQQMFAHVCEETLAGGVAEEVARVLKSTRFRVNPAFRRETNGMYFGLHGCSEEYDEFVDSDVLLSRPALEMLGCWARKFSEIAGADLTESDLAHYTREASRVVPGPRPLKGALL